jgi:Fe-S-cluster containining protein
MNLETDPKRIEKLAAQRERENMQFRAWLKHGRIGRARIDDLVHGLNEQISKQIDCCACANCCRTSYVEVREKDIRRLAKALGKTRADLIREHLDFNAEEKSYWLKGLPCAFLVDSKCSIYDARPDDCRSFPHLHNKDFTGRLLTVVENCSVCPIVFNVYEELKSRLGRR